MTEAPSPSSAPAPGGDGPDGQRPALQADPPPAGWPRLLAVVAARALLTFLVSMLLWSTAPAAFGWTPRLVLTGSMTPRIRAGDLVLTSPVSGAHVQPGRVIAFADPDRAGRTLVHRLVRRNPDGTLVTKGDANPTPDPTPVEPGVVSGLGRLRVPFIGLPVLWAHEHRWSALAAVAVLLGGAGWLVWSDTTGSGRADRSRRSPPKAVTGAAAITLGLLLAAAGPARQPVFAAFSGTTDSPNSSWTAAPVLIAPNSYVNTVDADAPQFLFRLAESSGTTAADASGNNRPGTYSGAFTFGVTPQPLPRNPGTAVAGNGSNSCVTSSYSASTSAYTVDLWFRTSSTAGGTLASIDANNSSKNLIALLRLNTTGTLTFTAYGAAGVSSSITSPATYNDNGWHYLSATLSASTGQRLYLDGTNVGSASYATGLYTASGSWQFGCTISGASSTRSAFFAGALADTAAYPTALSATRVQAHYFAA